jgi:hypothetical protein
VPFPRPEPRGGCIKHNGSLYIRQVCYTSGEDMEPLSVTEQDKRDRRVLNGLTNISLGPDDPLTDHDKLLVLTYYTIIGQWRESDNTSIRERGFKRRPRKCLDE